MTLQEALQWASQNTRPEAVERLRSRAVVKTLVEEIERLQRVISTLVPPAPLHLSPEQREAIQMQLNAGYRTFLDKAYPNAQEDCTDLGEVR